MIRTQLPEFRGQIVSNFTEILSFRGDAISMPGDDDPKKQVKDVSNSQQAPQPVRGDNRGSIDAAPPSAWAVPWEP
jgi:hypothetical protein